VISMAEIRRIQETGKGSLVVTIPKNWARKHGVRKGSTIYIYEREDGSLVLNLFRSKQEISTIYVNLKKKTRECIEWGVLGAYLLGYNKIIVRSRFELGLKERELVRKVIDKLIGVEIVDEKPNEITLQCIIDESFTNPENLFKRINSLVVYMVQNSLKLVEKFDKEKAGIIFRRDNEVDRLYFLLIRTLRVAVKNPALSDKFGLSPIECMDFRVAAEVLEEIGDIAVQITGVAEKINGLELNDVQNTIYELLSESFLAFLNNLTEKIEEIRKMNFKLKLLLKRFKEANSNIAELVKLLEKIGDLCVDLSDLLIPKDLFSEN